jgi:hypothetical protein
MWGTLMRWLPWLAIGTACLGLSCLPPGDYPGAGGPLTDSAGEQVGAATPDGTRCHSGTFECADGAAVVPCGSWHFDVNEMGGVSGAGEITAVLPDAPLQVTLGGAIDEGVESYHITLCSEAEGGGELVLAYDGPGLTLVGSWSFANGPEPTGVEVGGGVAGTSCVALP